MISPRPRAAALVPLKARISSQTQTPYRLYHLRSSAIWPATFIVPPRRNLSTSSSSLLRLNNNAALVPQLILKPPSEQARHKSKRTLERRAQRKAAAIAPLPTPSEGEIDWSVGTREEPFEPTQPFVPISIVLDIDGVLKQGPTVLDAAKRALKILNGENPWNRKIPHLFMTNGGGSSEADRAKVLAKELEVPVEPTQVLLAHTMLVKLTPDLGDKPVLALGGPDPDTTREVMTSYGFKNVFTAHDIHAAFPSIWPFTKPTTDHKMLRTTEDYSKVNFAAVIVFHDSRDWGRDIQIMSDVLKADNGVIGTIGPPPEPHQRLSKKKVAKGGKVRRPQLPVYFTHRDLIYKSDWPVPRYGQGAFIQAFKNVWQTHMLTPLQYEVFGKPELAPYKLAKQMLEHEMQRVTGRNYIGGPVHRVDGVVTHKKAQFFMIGDNPESDIAGGARSGWKTALVKTGVYQDSDPKPSIKPTVGVNDVEEAVKWAIASSWGVPGQQGEEETNAATLGPLAAGGLGTATSMMAGQDELDDDDDEDDEFDEDEDEDEDEDDDDDAEDFEGDVKTAHGLSDEQIQFLETRPGSPEEKRLANEFMQHLNRDLEGAFAGTEGEDGDGYDDEDSWDQEEDEDDDDDVRGR